MQLESLFSGEIQSGVYRVNNAEDLSGLTTQAQENDFAVFVFDGNTIFDMDDFLDQYEQLMSPPPYGRNWNGFEEWFRVCGWIKAKGIIVIYQEFQNFMSDTKGDFDEMIDIFIQMMPFRERVKVRYKAEARIVPFYILFQGDESIVLPIVSL